VLIKSITSLSLIALALSDSLSLHAKELTTTKNTAQLEFFDSLTSLCGERYEGAMTFPAEGLDSFTGKRLVADVASCSKTEIRIPFHAGEDKSRTWIVSKTNQGLQLKHDHRHEDGTPDDVNMYGGLATNSGSKFSQSFAADTHTQTIIPAASTNVWTMTLNSDDNSFTYHLTRHNKPRFTAKLFAASTTSKDAVHDN
jgi:hypothetical protein